MKDFVVYVLLPSAALVAVLVVLANHYLREDDDYQGTPEPARPAHARHALAVPAAARRTGPAYPDPDYQADPYRRTDRDRLDQVPAQLAAAASRAQHLNQQRHYDALEPDALEPCDMCGRVGLHTFSQWTREHSAWMAVRVAEAAQFAGQHGLDTAWAGNYDLADAA